MRYEKGPADNKKRRKGYIGVSRTTLRSLYGDKCVFCGVVMLFNPRDNTDLRYATLEHMIPRSRGGKKDWHNIRLSCRKCNSDKQDRTAEEYVEWWLNQIENGEV